MFFLGYLKIRIKELNPVELWEASLRKISTDPINNLKINSYETPGNKLKQISDNLLEVSKTQSFKDVSVDVVNRVYTLINKYGLHTTKRQKKFWKSIHK